MAHDTRGGGAVLPGRRRPWSGVKRVPQPQQASSAATNRLALGHAGSLTAEAPSRTEAPRHTSAHTRAGGSAASEGAAGAKGDGGSSC